MFLDEPTLSIDHVMAERITGMIRELKARHCTILLVTHDPRLASLVADRLVVIDAGRIVIAGPFDEVKRSADPRVRSVLERCSARSARSTPTCSTCSTAARGDGGRRPRRRASR